MLFLRRFPLTPERAAAARAAGGEADFRNEGDRSPVGNTPWHLDLTFWPVVGKEIVTVWIPLDPTDLGNTALFLLLSCTHVWRKRTSSSPPFDVPPSALCCKQLLHFP